MNKTFLFIIMLMLLGLSSCNKTEYRNVIPADANLVAEIDVKSIAEKADLAESGLLQTLQGFLSLVVSPKDKGQMDAYIKNPTSMGVDFSVPAYIFHTPDKLCGVTMKVADEGDLKNFLMYLHKQNLATRPAKRDGLMCGSLMGEFSYSYNDATLLLVVGMGGEGGSAKVARQLMNQKEEDGFFEKNEGAAAFEAEHGKDIVVYSNIAQMLGRAKSFLPSCLAQKNDMRMVAAISFDKGKASVKTTLLTQTKEVKDLMDEVDKNLYTIGGDYIPLATDSTLVWAAAGVNGGWMESVLTSNTMAKEALFILERAVDIRMMVRSIDGDLAVVVPMSQNKESEATNTKTKTKTKTNTKTKTETDFMMLARLKEKSFLDDVPYWKESHKDYGITMQDDGRNHYVVSVENNTLKWGVDGDNLYLASDLPQRMLSIHDGSPLREYEKEIKESKIFVYLNIHDLQDMGVNGMPSLLNDMPKRLKCATIKSDSPASLTLTIHAKDQNENILKQILK